nr:ATP-grasp domain-containing protein [Bacilli bacterium]
MKKNGWLIYRKEDVERNRYLIDQYITLASELSLSLTLVYYEQLVLSFVSGQRQIIQQTGHALPDFIIFRTIDPSMTEFLQALGIPVFNNADVARICNDKWLTYGFASDCHVPIPDTVPYRFGEMPFAYPFIVKSTTGRGGKEVYLLKNEEDRERFDAKQSKALSWIAQPLTGRYGEDVRVFIVGDQIVAAVHRFSRTDFRSNYTLGGDVRPYPLQQKQIAILQKVLKPLSFGAVGVDFLLDDHERFILNEIEDVVGSRSLYRTSSINFPLIYLNYIISQL